MAFRPGRREKLAGGIIIVLVGIALLHYFIFQPKQGAYRQAKGEYDSVRSRYETMKSAPTNQIPDYIKVTSEKSVAVDQIVKDLKPCFPEYFLDASRMQEDFLALVKQIGDLRNSNTNIKWDFLGDGGWNFSTQLPQPIIRKQIVIEDIVKNVKAGDRLIAIMTDPREKARHQNAYLQSLMQLGVDMNKGLSFAGTYGEIVPNLYLAYHAMMITDATSPEAGVTLFQMLELLRPGFNKTTFFEGITMHTTNKQLEALVDLLKIASTHNLESISRVEILKNKMTTPKIDLKGGATPSPTPAPAYDEFMMFGMMEEGGPMGMEGMMFPGGRMGGRPVEEVKPEDSIANVTGFKIRFTAQNSEAMKFLFDVANSRRAFVIDDLAVSTVKDGRVDVIVTILAYTWIADVCN